MQIGCIADVHGNLPALQAVLAAMPPVDAILCAGDVVGYYPDVNEVCEMLQMIGAYVIRGNHDGYVTGELTPDPSRRVAYRTDWTRDRLTPENLAWLKALPVQMTFNFKAISLVLRHASPWDEETYLYPDSEALNAIDLGENMIYVFGHTHHPMWQNVSKGYVLNPGSVGQPRDYNSHASFALLNTATMDASIFRVDYDVIAYQIRLRKQGWDEATISILNRKRM